MAQAEPTVIMPRRGFLTHAFGFTAAGATLALPIITVADAKTSVEHHAKALESAMRDYYAGLDVQLISNRHTPDQVREWDIAACYCFVASPYIPDDLRPTFKSWQEYDSARSTVSGQEKIAKARLTSLEVLRLPVE